MDVKKMVLSFIAASLLITGYFFLNRGTDYDDLFQNGGFLRSAEKMPLVTTDIQKMVGDQKIVGRITFEGKGDITFFIADKNDKTKKLRYTYLSPRGWEKPYSQVIDNYDKLWDLNSADLNAIPNLVNDALKRVEEGNMERPRLYAIYVGPEGIEILIKGTRKDAYYYADLKGIFKKFQFKN